MARNPENPVETYSALDCERQFQGDTLQLSAFLGTHNQGTNSWICFISSGLDSL
jgi:hypothetical protein